MHLPSSQPAAPADPTVEREPTSGLEAMLRGVRLRQHGGLARELGMQLLAARLGAAEPPHVGRYRVVSKLGEGGMGVVFRAHDPLLSRDVALKVLRMEGGAEAATRMAAEARSLAAVAHPNVLAVHDVGVDDESAWIVTELVTGGTLREWVSAQTRSWQSIVERFLESARGLATAHRMGLVHRDFKPDNVLIGAEGRARVSDFGLARHQELLTELSAGSPGSSVIEGTASYLAPELLRGVPASAASDQYAFFVSLRELLGDRATGLADDLIAQGTQREPEARFDSMDAVIAELEDLLRPAARLSQPSLEDLVAIGQEATDRQSYLEAALGWVQRVVGYDTALLGRADREGELGPRIEGFEDTLLAQFREAPELYAPPLVGLELASAAARRPVTDTEVLSQRDRSMSAFHADLLGKKGTRVMAVAALAAAGKQLGSLQISRNARGTRFSDREQRLLAAAAPILALGLAAHEPRADEPTDGDVLLLRLWSRGLAVEDIATVTGSSVHAVAERIEDLCARLGGAP